MKLSWLDTKAIQNSGSTFGVPWKKGILQKDNQYFELDSVPVQSWPTAFWPDGSVKWTAHAAIFKDNVSDAFELTTTDKKSWTEKGIVEEKNDQYIVHNGKYTFYINKKGQHLIDRVTDSDQKIIAEKLEMFASIMEASEETDRSVQVISNLHSRIEVVDVENTGSIYTVLIIKGFIGDNTELPFTVRLKFFYGTSDIKIISSNFYDLEDVDKRIVSLGLRFEMALAGESYNRHVKLVTEEGMYIEPATLLSTRRYRFSEEYENQIKGNIVEQNEDNTALINEAMNNAHWNDFKFSQISDSLGQYAKRTNGTNAWLTIPAVDKSRGMMHVADENDGVSIGLRYFNDKYPSQLSVSNLNKEKTSFAIYFWSPDSEPMDLRHYDNDTHVDSAYEGFEEMRATPEGIANTSEATITFYSERVSDEVLIDDAKSIQQPPLLIAEPDYYYDTEATGEWALIDKSTEKVSFIENELEKVLNFYKMEVSQRKWTGYWNFGDVMHSYDKTRSQWFYDQGGYAWQNTELVPNLWLWYSFFRSKDASTFRLVEAMTKHNAEVDRYHFGEYEGLGSRHNVSHWGCGCKEARISMACLFKYYYYLTGDERTKELLDETKDTDQALKKLDPMRAYYPEFDNDNRTHVRIGPDWAAFVSNWMSQWERNQDKAYLDKIKKGLNDLKEMPYRLLTGPVVEYDTETHALIDMGTGLSNGYHMTISFGAPEVWIELAQLLGDEAFKDMIAEFGKVYGMTNEQKLAFSEGKLDDTKFHWPMFASGIVAYAADYYDDQVLAERAWTSLLQDEESGVSTPIETSQTDDWKKLTEIPWLTTNVASQWSLNMLLALKHIKRYL